MQLIAFAQVRDAIEVLHRVNSFASRGVAGISTASSRTTYLSFLCKMCRQYLIDMISLPMTTSYFQTM